MRNLLLSLTCLVLVLSLVTTVSSADLLVHYKFDETADTIAVDASGNGYDGAITGNANWVEGYIGGALEFTGDCSVTLPSEGMGLTSFIGSVAFWMKADVPDGINTMFWAGDNTTGGGFGAENEMHVHLESAVDNVWLGGELSFFVIADPSVHLHSDPDKGIAPGTVPVDPILLSDLIWHHVAVVWDGDNGVCKMYIDGIPIFEIDYTFSPYDLSHIFLGHMAEPRRYYTGILDDVRIYSDALTNEDVFVLFENMDSVDDRPVAKSEQFVLNQNYPNPFNPTTTISYQLAKSSDVLLAIYNQNGQLVRTLVQEKQRAGSQSVSWNGCDDAGHKLSSGIYLYRLQANNEVQTRKLMLMK